MKKGWQPVSASVTILVDNTIMELVSGSSFIARLSKPGNSFLAEHGFSALIECGGKKILLDTGATGVAVLHNLKLIGLQPEDIDMVVLSHGHNDHTGGLNLFHGKIIAHPDAFVKRYLVTPAGASFDLTCPVQKNLKDRAQLEKGPVMLAPGIWTTGEIERTHKWEELDLFRIRRENDMESDSIRDDQAVVISSGSGLAIIAGCSHAGIINTIEQAVRISGINEVYCVIGGFHLIGPGENKIERTIAELKRLKVKKIVPIHCTGFEGIKRLSIEMPREFEYATAGCKISL
ncbi:MAG: MBL fold metallo-hydrolase [Nitrospiraceae bacterium]|nr:MBL fold metallo-hydrolase [Nitrospiraceae bacterium]